MTFTIGIPQLIYLLLTVISLAIALLNHGKDKDTQYNFWGTLVAEIILIALLYWGGFFK